MTYVERSIILRTLDNLWRDQIVNLDHLRSVIGFRAYAQRDPLQEYKAEAFELFKTLLNNLRQAAILQLSRVELVRQPAPERELPIMQVHHLSATTGVDEFASIPPANDLVVAPTKREPENPATWGRIGRNQACPCGTGKKYKHCHGVFEQHKTA
jgi:preprotein translocase subunit SecA